MSKVLATLNVVRHDNGLTRRVQVVEGLTSDHFDCIAHEWMPALKSAGDRAVLAFAGLSKAKRDDAAWQEKQRIYGAPDSHWDWAEKVQSMGPMNRLLALVEGATVEAVMRVDLSRASRIDTVSYKPIVYVEYLAVGPWNRPPIQSPPRFKGLGTLMLGVAIEISRDAGMDGRCGLHSLVQSEGFYRRCGMQDLGIDHAEGMNYFEFSPGAANKFLEV